MATPTSYGTPYVSLIRSARIQIAAANERSGTYRPDNFWSDDEIFGYAKRGTADLWEAVIDLHHEHFLTLNSTDVSLQSGVNQLSGVPIDTFRIYDIEPSSPTTTSCMFVPRAVNSRDFKSAFWQGTQAPVNPSGIRVFYCLTGAGAPNSTPIVRTAPSLAAAVALNFWYVPSLGLPQYVLATATNPIPGESDQALINWIIAYMRAKERDDRTPDPSWIALYASEKQNLMSSLTPRQDQEAEFVESIF